ncbi:hypothetical protein QE152_g24806 [Popillia japonica]|uniref:Uncharacterized protein n=1 Tax=Popillia japonica TaxID=7064 RepID=A0AAW1K4G8_POPJA
MDNAPYHSVKSEKLPTATWKKDALVNWLLSKGILCDNTQLKIELLDLTKQYLRDNPVSYVIDDMVAETGFEFVVVILQINYLK